ncbi:MAG: LysR family transcriptional regulator, partial [Burkholderiales bacterium]|nr:LysR family transcriptional regulator [Burkholderiales bacterium]
MKFTFRQLEYFSAAAEAGSIAAAAECIHISAPSISVAITQLEQQLGVALFIRGHAGLSLTTAGQDVLARSRALLAQARDLHDSVASNSAGLKGRIALGCMTTLAPMLLPELVRGFAGAHPGVSVESVEGSQDQLIGQLRRGVVDVAISYDMHVPQDLQFEPLVALPPQLLMAAGHRLAHRPSIALAEVAADDYILLDLPFSRDYFLSVFQQAGLEPKVALRTTQMDVVRTLV